MKITKTKLKQIIKEELNSVLLENKTSVSKDLLKEDYVYNKILMPTQKNPSDSATKCHQGPRDCPPDTSGHFAARTVSGYGGSYWDEIISDFKIFWNPICSGQEGNFEKTQMVHKWTPQLQPEQLKQYACEYKKALADGLVAYRDYKAQYYPQDPAIERIENALKTVAGMVPERPEAISTPQERSLEQEKASRARAAKSRLKEIIKEEVEKVLKEGLEDSEAGSRHYQNVKRKERILKKAIKDGLTFDQVQDKYTEFYDLDPEYYKHLKTEKPSEALEEEVDETMDSGYLSEPKNKKDEDK